MLEELTTFKTHVQKQQEEKELRRQKRLKQKQRPYNQPLFEMISNSFKN